MDLTTTIDLFAELEPEERLEILIEYGAKLGELPVEFADMRNKGLYIVHECQAPVFFYVDVAQTKIHIEVDVPEEAAIARGFSTLLQLLFNGKEVPARSEVPPSMLKALRVDTLLGLQRKKGLSAIYKTVLERLPA